MSLDDLLRKKGNYPILNELKYRGDNYNSIKEQLDPKISARTLDHRLNELTEWNILTTEVYDRRGPIRKFYNLTEKGRILLATLEAIREILASSMNLNTFLEYISEQMEIYEKLEFEWIWSEIKTRVKKGESIYSLSEDRPNKIKEINEKGIKVKTDSGEGFVSIDKIKHAWKNLVQDGILYQFNHEKATYRSSFMLALFSELPIVEKREDPALAVIISLKP